MPTNDPRLELPHPPSGPSGESGWRIAVVEDHLLQRRRTEDLVRSQSAFRLVHSCETLPEHLAWLDGRRRAQWPHLLVLDLVVERGDDVDPGAVRSLIGSGVRVLVLSALGSPPLVREVLRAGVHGVAGKRDAEADVVSAIWSVLGGRSWMTPELADVLHGRDGNPNLSEQEERALVLYASGLTLDAVAAHLGVTRNTAKTYLDRVRAKYRAVGRDVRSKVDLSRAAIADGFLDVGPDEGDAATSLGR